MTVTAGGSSGLWRLLGAARARTDCRDAWQLLLAAPLAFYRGFRVWKLAALRLLLGHEVPAGTTVQAQVTRAAANGGETTIVSSPWLCCGCAAPHYTVLREPEAMLG